MSGEARLWAGPVRAGLWLVSRAYQLIIDARNRRYDCNSSRVRRLPVPVISVGNITAGGTGKTPLVIELVRRLRARGRCPAVVSRGYRAQSNQAADELLLVRRHVGEVIAVADADRVAGGMQAIERGADVIVLDDAFQHRHVHRDLDIVMIDATCAFGYDHLLPRGLLREPLRGLTRADIVVLSRTDSVDADRIEVISNTIRQYNADAPILRSRHRPTQLAALDGGCADLTTLRDRRVICVAGIGNPDAFVETVRQLGATPIHHIRRPDHAPYDPAAYRTLAAAAEGFPDAEYLVTTEKDLVKMEPRCRASVPLPIVAVAIAIDLPSEDDRILEAALERLLAPARNEDCDAERALQTDRSD